MKFQVHPLTFEGVNLLFTVWLSWPAQGSVGAYIIFHCKTGSSIPGYSWGIKGHNLQLLSRVSLHKVQLGHIQGITLNCLVESTCPGYSWGTQGHYLSLLGGVNQGHKRALPFTV